jgi:hypothetical protein
LEDREIVLNFLLLRVSRFLRFNFFLCPRFFSPYDVSLEFLATLFMTESVQLRPLLSILVILGLATVPSAFSQEVPIEKVFAAVPFDAWARQSPHTEVPWKVQIRPYGLSLHQRLRAYVGIQLHRRELVKLPPEARILVLVQVTDAAGKQFREYGLFRMKDIGVGIKKGEVALYWDVYVLPGEYKVTVMLFESATGAHNVIQDTLRVEPLKNDPLSAAWAGLPPVEFLAQDLKGPDLLYRPEVEGRLHLPLPTRRPVKLEVLADVTASDLFHGSTVFYNRYLSVALPLLKALSQIRLERGSLDVAMLDLRKRTVTFEQKDVKELDWPLARSVLAPENGPATIDIKALAQRRESPAFLQDELLRRLNSAPEEQRADGDPVHVFVIIGSPMDFYSFRDLPHLPPGSEEKCVVYYLQFELLNMLYADGAVGNVRKMLNPLPVRVFKVRSPESIRHALARMLEEMGSL